MEYTLQDKQKKPNKLNHYAVCLKKKPQREKMSYFGAKKKNRNPFCTTTEISL